MGITTVPNVKDSVPQKKEGMEVQMNNKLILTPQV